MHIERSHTFFGKRVLLRQGESWLKSANRKLSQWVVDTTNNEIDTPNGLFTQSVRTVDTMEINFPEYTKPALSESGNYEAAALISHEPDQPSVALQTFGDDIEVQEQIVLKPGNCCNVSITSWKESVLTAFQPPIKRNCELLRKGNKQEINRIRTELRTWKNAEYEEQWIQRLSNCSVVIQEFSSNFYVSPEELKFPLAYIFVIYTNARQMVRLLKAIYRPHNLYCMHPDAKQSEEFIDVFRKISKCLDNVFVASKLEKVYYQHHTIMDSQLNCMEDLIKYQPSRWRYVINLCGRELPLKTNREIVGSLKRLNGANAVDVVSLNSYLIRDRFTYKATLNYTTQHLYYTNEHVGKPPHHIKLYKSMNFIAATRTFVDFLLHNQKAIDFRNYLKEIKIPEEHFFSSLSMLPEVLGGRKRPRGVPVIDSYIWYHPRKKHQGHYCAKNVHFVCILTVGDLPDIYRLGVYNRRPQFFFNKYFMEDDHVVMDCMEERLVQQNVLEYKQDCG